ncbi:fimbrial protein [Trabulsiella odontotermitis]|uniref:fimbrial protein n=1 Tax=Trabulsiella odontotermitis TaxID=379893 RepID=UPI0024B81E66|nr:fimbrial protein [Trabulsiella odontotermitis]WHP33074.1 fimbrial protein [Trabulsiella odontotermitis]
MFQVFFKLFTLVVILVAGTTSAQAYMVKTNSTEENCVPATPYTQVSVIAGKLVQLQASDFLNLADGQYLFASGSAFIGGSTSASFKFSLRCDNLGEPQSSIVYKSEFEASASVIVVDQSSILEKVTPIINDETGKAALVKTNVQGLYSVIRLRAGADVIDYPPSRLSISALSVSNSNADGRYVVDNSFRGIPEGMTIIPAVPSIQFMVSDENDGSKNAADKGMATLVLHLANETNPVVKITSTCQYTLSDGGNVDFGGQRLSQITDDRNTTIKRAMTLNMDNCYGVNKVKTYITTTGTSSDSGLLLNNSVSDGAKNVAVALRVNPSYTESGNAGDNAGKDMYFDSSNPLEWNFGNTWEVTPLSKHIPLDVYLLRTGGEPTPGDYHATATIMMDFI